MTKEEIENYRLKFLDWLSEYMAGCKIREEEDRERDNLFMQSCNDLFEEFFKKNQQFVNQQIKKVINEKTKIIDKYQELILAVENKHDGETRHETALRILKGPDTACDMVYN